MTHAAVHRVAGLVALGLTLGLPSSAKNRLNAQQRWQSRTYTYKTVGDLAIKADVHRANDDQVRPVVVWIHGGALINGHRQSVSSRLKQPLLDAGFTIVSIDYRLAPETPLSELITDVEDAFAWVRQQGPRLFRVDPERIAVMGGSAGGYLTLATGYRVKPRPQALVALWGYGDLIGDWYSSPSKHPRHNRVSVSERQARSQVSGPPISDARQRNGNGGLFYQFCRQQGSWPREVSGGWDPHTEPERFYPYMPVKNVSPKYPPTLMIHGTDDTDVPYEQSVMMAEQLEQHGVEHQLITIEGGEHGLRGGDPAQINAAYQAALAFVRWHLH